MFTRPSAALFAIVGIGSPLGAMFGAQIAKRVYVPIGPYNMMLPAAGVLLACLGLTCLVHRDDLAGSKGAGTRPTRRPGARRAASRSSRATAISSSPPA